MSLEILKKARDLISDPAKWTRNVFARDASGDEVPPTDSQAVCFCAAGAVGFAMGTCGGDEWWNAIKELERDLPANLSVAGVNDYQGHEAVLAAFDKTIARLEAAQ